MDNLVFDGRGDSLLGCHSSRRGGGGGWGYWVSPIRPERLRRRLTADVDKKKKQANNPNQKLEKKIKNTWWKSNNAIKVFSL